MRLTIVQPDRLTLVDGIAQHFNLQDLGVPPNLHALQWNNKEGHIEYSNEANETISALPEWVAAVIAEHQRLTEEQRQPEDKQARAAVFVGNGQARIDRLERRQSAAKTKEFETLKQRVEQLETSHTTQGA